MDLNELREYNVRSAEPGVFSYKECHKRGFRA